MSVWFDAWLLPLQAKVTTELSQVLDEEEKRWMETLHIEEYQINLSKTVIQVSPTGPLPWQPRIRSRRIPACLNRQRRNRVKCCVKVDSTSFWALITFGVKANIKHFLISTRAHTHTHLNNLCFQLGSYWPLVVSITWRHSSHENAHMFCAKKLFFYGYSSAKRS